MRIFQGLTPNSQVKIDGRQATVVSHDEPEDLYVIFSGRCQNELIYVHEVVVSLYDDFFGTWDDVPTEDVGYYYPEEPMLNPGGGSYNIEDER